MVYRKTQTISVAKTDCKNLDGLLDIALVRERHAAAGDIFPRPLAQCFDVR